MRIKSFGLATLATLFALGNGNYNKKINFYKICGQIFFF